MFCDWGRKWNGLCVICSETTVRIMHTYRTCRPWRLKWGRLSGYVMFLPCPTSVLAHWKLHNWSLLLVKVLPRPANLSPKVLFWHWWRNWLGEANLPAPVYLETGSRNDVCTRWVSDSKKTVQVGNFDCPHIVMIWPTRRDLAIFQTLLGSTETMLQQVTPLRTVASP